MAIKLNMCVLSKIVLDLKNRQKAICVAKLNKYLGIDYIHITYMYLYVSLTNCLCKCRLYIEVVLDRGQFQREVVTSVCKDFFNHTPIG